MDRLLVPFRALGQRWTNASLARQQLGKYIIAAASMVHVIWAILLTLDSGSRGSTPISIIAQVCGGPVRAAVVLGVAAFAAMAYPLLKNDVRNATLALMLIPQQALLIMSAGAGIRAAAVGHYADGVARGSAFILGDQLAIIVMALLYSVAVIEAAMTPGGTPSGTD